MKVWRKILTVYGNFVDILDEMAITKNEIYGVTDIKPFEKKLYEDKVKGTAAATPTAPTN